MKNRKSYRNIFVLFGFIALFSCDADKEAPVTVPVPEVLAVSADAQVSCVEMNAVITNAVSVTDCGFYLGKHSDGMQRVVGVLSGDTIRASVDSLEASTLYYYYAFAGNGVNEICSETGSFQTRPLPDPEPDDPEPDDPEPDDPDPEEDLDPDDPDPDVNPQPEVPADSIVYVENDEFRAYLVWQYDLDGDGKLSYSEAAQVVSLDYRTDNLENLTGLEAFVNMRHIGMCGTREGNTGYGKLVKADFRTMPFLAEVDLAHNMRLKSVDISNCPDLWRFEACLCGLESLDVSGNPNITLMNIEENHLKSMDVTAVTNLEWMSLCNNELEWVNVAGLDKLEELKLNGNRLKELDISECRHLHTLVCRDNPDLKVIYMAKGQVLNILEKDEHTEIVVVE